MAVTENRTMLVRVLGGTRELLGTLSTLWFFIIHIHLKRDEFYINA